MSECRVYYRSDKSIAIISLAKNSILSKEDGYAKCAKESGLEGLDYDDIDTSDLPQSREHRNAWEGGKGKPITINSSKIEPVKKTLEERVKDLENAGV